MNGGEEQEGGGSSSDDVVITSRRRRRVVPQRKRRNKADVSKGGDLWGDVTAAAAEDLSTVPSAPSVSCPEESPRVKAPPKAKRKRAPKATVESSPSASPQPKKRRQHAKQAKSKIDFKDSPEKEDIFAQWDADDVNVLNTATLSDDDSMDGGECEVSWDFLSRARRNRKEATVEKPPSPMIPVAGGVKSAPCTPTDHRRTDQVVDSEPQSADGALKAKSPEQAKKKHVLFEDASSPPDSEQSESMSDSDVGESDDEAEIQEKARLYREQLNQKIDLFHSQRRVIEAQVRQTREDMEKSILIRMLFFVSGKLPMWTTPQKKVEDDSKPCVTIDLPFVLHHGLNVSVTDLMHRLWPLESNTRRKWNEAPVSWIEAVNRAANIQTEVAKRAEAARKWAAAAGLGEYTPFRLRSSLVKQRLKSKFSEEMAEFEKLVSITEEEAAETMRVKQWIEAHTDTVINVDTREDGDVELTESSEYEESDAEEHTPKALGESDESFTSPPSVESEDVDVWSPSKKSVDTTKGTPERPAEDKMEDSSVEDNIPNTPLTHSPVPPTSRSPIVSSDEDRPHVFRRHPQLAQPTQVTHPRHTHTKHHQLRSSQFFEQQAELSGDDHGSDEDIDSEEEEKGLAELQREGFIVEETEETFEAGVGLVNELRQAQIEATEEKQYKAMFTMEGLKAARRQSGENIDLSDDDADERELARLKRRENRQKTYVEDGSESDDVSEDVSECDGDVIESESCDESRESEDENHSKQQPENFRTDGRRKRRSRLSTSDRYMRPKKRSVQVSAIESLFKSTRPIVTTNVEQNTPLNVEELRALLSRDDT